MLADIVLAKLRQKENVLGAYAMKQSLFLNVELEETRISAACGVKYENRGVFQDRDKDLHICIFSKGFLQEPTESRLILTDDTGTIYGQDVPRGMPHSKLVDEKNGVWVSDDFIIYPDTIPKSEPRFVIVSNPYDGVGAEEGVKDVTAFNPAISTDELLKNAFGFGGGKNITSTIVSMNRLRSVAPTRTGRNRCRFRVGEVPFGSIRQDGFVRTTSRSRRRARGGRRCCAPASPRRTGRLLDGEARPPHMPDVREFFDGASSGTVVTENERGDIA